jgi:hypothetical protein
MAQTVSTIVPRAALTSDAVYKPDFDHKEEIKTHHCGCFSTLSMLLSYGCGVCLCRLFCESPINRPFRKPALYGCHLRIDFLFLSFQRGRFKFRRRKG